MADILVGLRVSLAERYRIEHELGHGAMATVYLAHDLKHDRPVALKVLRPELARAVSAERFLREVKLIARLQHPHILPLYDSGDAAGALYYVMPYSRGESLRDRIERERQLPLDDVLRIARELADALGFAHEHGIVHRDVKPENVLLVDSHALVADFGVARAIRRSSGEVSTDSGLTLGTPVYMSPEQASADRELDGRSDIYSFACLLYEMLAGTPPFTGPSAQVAIARRFTEAMPSLRIVRPEVPERVERALRRALAVAPEDRFGTMREFADALDDVTPPATMRRHRLSLAGMRPPGAPPATGRRPATYAGLALLALLALYAALGQCGA